ncbi:hypothetical protein PQX77_012467 [Marasmius sp. AFHP31]|nr:hypothetical protein PQX77_012467 [Marasmius sp. AFHP31]
MSATFGCSREIVIRGKQQFQQAHGNINNYYLSDEGPLAIQRQGYESLTPIQRRFREIRQGDVILRSQVYSGGIEMEMEQKLKSTNPFRPRLEVKTVKIRTKVFHTELRWREHYGADRLAELAHAVELSAQYNTNNLVSYYIVYQWISSHKALKMELPLSKAIDDVYLNLETFSLSTDVEGIRKSFINEYNHWTFNFGTHSWQYNLISASVSPPEKLFFLNTAQPPSLHHKPSPQLNTDEITIWLEQKFGDFLYLFTFLAGWFREPSPFARHGLLTFGAVVHCHKGIVAYLPSLPSPEWFCHSLTVENQASYSMQVPSRVDIKFHTPGEIVIQFSLRLPAEFSTAYLSQSSSFVRNTATPENDLAFINSVHFMMTGVLRHDPATQSTPLYLFVPPIPVEHINGVHCVRYPLLDGLFYWSFDPDGKDVVPVQDWEELGVPELNTILGISSHWLDPAYNCVQDHLVSRGYSLDGKRYARDYGYPELILDDPHDIWFQAESFSLVELFGENQSDNDQASTDEQAAIDMLPNSSVAPEYPDSVIGLTQLENAITLTKDNIDPRDMPNAANPPQDLCKTAGSPVLIPRPCHEHADTRPVTLIEALAQLCEVVGLIAVIVVSSTVRTLLWLLRQKMRDEKS